MSKADITITSVEFRNYKAFEHFSVTLNRMNVFVGPNNAGKSTLLGAFRALDAALRRARARKPDLIEGPTGPTYGYHLSQEALPISIENIHTDYSERDTTVTFRLSNANKLLLFFPRDGGCSLIPITEKRQTTSVASFVAAFPITLTIVPVLGPVEHKEELVRLETVKSNIGTHRASRNFRNYWYYFPDRFGDFESFVKRSWPGMEIQRPERVDSFTQELVMYCLEDRMTRELFWAGSGFQIWCQLLTHVALAESSTLLVVDEPEVYLHPDMQRRLFALLRSTNPDVLIATHSTEIISDADPAEILLVDKKQRAARRLRDIESVQSALDGIGSIQNISLTRLARNRTVLFVEGANDYSILRSFARRLGLENLASGTDLTPIESEGFSSWDKVKSLGWGIEKTLGESLRLGALYDRDYHCQEEIDDILSELQQHLTFSHVHERKEIENYLLVPEVLDKATQRAVEDRARRLGESPQTISSVSTVLESITESMKTRLQAQYIGRRVEYLTKSKRDVATITQQTIEWFDQKWSSLDTRVEIVPGKEVLKLLRDDLQKRYSISLTFYRIIDSFRRNDVPEDLIDLLHALEHFRLRSD